MAGNVKVVVWDCKVSFPPVYVPNGNVGTGT